MVMDFVADEHIAGAKVLRTFTTVTAKGDVIWFKRGDVLTAAQLLGFNPNNRHALIEANYIVVRYGMAATPGQRFIIKEKDGYAVIEGRKLNDKPLDREAAQELMNAT
jgi:hypothetical protein